MTERVLISGSSGFVGAHVLRHMLQHTTWTFALPVTFRHKGTPQRIVAALHAHPEWWDRIDVIRCDLTAPIDPVTAHQFGDVDIIMNVASESHVDRSIESPGPFIANNVALMTNLLDYARQIQPILFLHMSTDEVYGPAYDDDRHPEWSTILPSNPYSASKAAQEAIGFSYWRTYNVPLVITNTMNLIGEAQDPEKMVPKTIRALRDGTPVTVHTAPDGTPGSRFYLHARNLADAWLFLAAQASLFDVTLYGDGELLPDRYNIVGEQEVTNTNLVWMIANIMGVEPVINPVSFHESRPGHDLRYALDGTLMNQLGWEAPVQLEESLKRTVTWFLANPQWLS